MIDYIGGTPLIKLNYFSKMTDCNIYGKAEFMNPGGSVKDRAALYIIQDALNKGQIQPGGTVVEGTAGNTGIGLSLIAKKYNMKVIIVIPETQTKEKKDTLRATGAQLIEVPAAPYTSENNYVKYSKKIAGETNNPNGVLWANQFDNTANMQGHYHNTGPEIYKELNGKVDGFICSVGTGGTLAGISKYLQENSPGVEIGLADPFGAALYSYYTSGVLKTEGDSFIEGIGQIRITENLRECKPTAVYQIPDSESFDVMFSLVKEEGLFLGGSSGINVAGAIRLAKKIGPGKNIVTILCDSGSRYLSKLYDPIFLKRNNLPCPLWLQS